MNDKPRLFLNEFALKILGMVLMTLDHLGVFLMSMGYFPDGSPAYWTGYVFRCLGRIAFPLFAFMLAEGLHHTHSKEKYLERLGLIWGLLMVVEIVLYFLKMSTDANPFTDLVLFALFIILSEKKGPKKVLAALPLGYIILSFMATSYEAYLGNVSMLAPDYLAYFPSFVRSSYSLYGFLVFLGFYYAPWISEKIIARSVGELGSGLAEFKLTPAFQRLVNVTGITLFVCFTLLFWGIYHGDAALADPYIMGIESYGLIAVLPLSFYNGKRGYDGKAWRYIEYLYFPLHLAIIAAIFALIFH